MRLFRLHQKTVLWFSGGMYLINFIVPTQSRGKRFEMSKSNVMEVIAATMEENDAKKVTDNVLFFEKDGKLTLVIDLGKNFGKSSTGKSEIVASTHGIETYKALGKKYGISVNVFVKAEKQEKAKKVSTADQIANLTALVADLNAKLEAKDAKSGKGKRG
jgi:hypothetical protein